jgi:hypothetical protein
MRWITCEAVELGDEYIPVLLRELFPWQDLKRSPEYIYKLQGKPNWVIDLDSRTQILLIDFYNNELEDFIENVLKFNFSTIGGPEDAIEEDWKMFKRRSTLKRMDDE